LGKFGRLAVTETVMITAERFFIALAIVGLIGLALTIGRSMYL